MNDIKTIYRHYLCNGFLVVEGENGLGSGIKTGSTLTLMPDTQAHEGILCRAKDGTEIMAHRVEVQLRLEDIANLIELLTVWQNAGAE